MKTMGVASVSSVREWLWRTAAIGRARADACPLDAEASACAERARTLAGLAERHLAESEPWTNGEQGTPETAVGVALALYRDAEREVRRVLPEATPTDRASDDSREALDAIRTFVQMQLEEITRLQGDVDALLAQRFVRTGGLLVALVSAALSPRLAWFVVHPDRAPDAHWVASSAEVGYVSSGRGFAPPDFKIPAFFHTTEQPSPSITFDLDRIVDVRAVTVVNRGDCCGDRAVPLLVEVSENNLSWREVTRRTTDFHRWEARFAPTSARWVRLRVPRPTRLHLESVAIR